VCAADVLGVSSYRLWLHQQRHKQKLGPGRANCVPPQKPILVQ
jgi:hypothetical protein